MNFRSHKQSYKDKNAVINPNGFGDFFVRICLFLPLKAVKVWGYLEVFEVTELLSGY
mgnify:CR=1 FL=1